MSRWAIAAFIWLGLDIILGAVALPVIVTVFIPGLMNAWTRHDVGYMVAILLPNITLMIFPGALVAGAYVFIAGRVSRH